MNKYYRQLLVFLLTLSSSPLSFAAGKPCTHNSDINKITNIYMKIVHEETADKKNCTIVTENHNNPAVTQKKSLKISVPAGFCSHDDGWNDCTNDRSRSELFDAISVDNNKEVTYELYLYIPSSTNLLQNGTENRLFLSQLNTIDVSHYTSPVMLEWTDNVGLEFVTYDNFDWTISQRTPIGVPLALQKDSWIKIKYVVKVTNSDNGYIKLFANDQMVYSKNRATTVSSSGQVKLKIGIYNTKVSSMNNPRTTQVVYYDAITKTEI